MTLGDRLPSSALRLRLPNPPPGRARCRRMESLASLLDTHPLGPLLRTVGEVAAREGIETYAVGGVVRDLLLDRTTTDVDFVTVGADTGLRLAEAVRTVLGGRRVHVYERYGTAAIALPERSGEHALEFVTARR